MRQYASFASKKSRFNKIAKGILHSYTFFFNNYRQIDVILSTAINNASSAASQIPLC